MEKPWGYELIWAHSELYVGKLLVVRAGESLSLQFHEEKDETLHLVQGTLLFEAGPGLEALREVRLEAGMSVRIEPGMLHRMEAVTDCRILEASTPELDDVVRVRDRYGRAPTAAEEGGSAGAGETPGGSSRTPLSARTEVRVPGGRDYPVLVEPGGLEELAGLLARHAPAHQYALVADEEVARLHGARVRASLEATGRPVIMVTVPQGEASKSRDEWARITDELLGEGLGRDGCIVALGGGVTGDLAGFVAATFMRGVPLVQLPTSLVAMIDSAVGGKTGVDTAAGKNLVGAFHPPRLVLADPELARTLPPSERAQGLAEAVKHGAIVDLPYLEALEAGAVALLQGEVEATTRAVARSVAIKAGVVSRDEREEGLREILNFGHTLGHALEACSGYRLPHGSAVARGMVLEARLGERLGITEGGTARRLAQALDAVGLPTGGELPATPAELVQMAHADKKARKGVVRIVLLEGVGSVAQVAGGGGWSHPVDDAEVESLLADEGTEPGV